MAEAFSCKRCGHCCQGAGGIILSAGDQARLVAHLNSQGLNGAEELASASYVRLGKRQLTTGPDGYCIYYRQDAGGCGIHPARPDVCRAWPFFRGNLVDKLSWRMIQEDCRGVNPEVTFEEFVRAGLEYLRLHGLDASADEDANALRCQDLGER